MSDKLTGKSKVTWNDLQEGVPKELMKTYGLSERQLQVEMHKHFYGASRADKEAVYRKVYDKGRR